MRRGVALLVRAAAHAAGRRAAPASSPAFLETAQCNLQSACNNQPREASAMDLRVWQRHLSSSARHDAAAKKQAPELNWPLPVEVLAAHPELAQAALADAAQVRSQAEDAAQSSSATSTEPLEYRESAGTAARLGGVVKRRTRKHRLPPTAGPLHPTQLTSMSPDEVAEVMADAHARDVVILDVRQTCDFADSMVIATGNSNGHVRAVARAVHSKMKQHRPEHLKENTGVAPLPVEGTAASNWTVVDAGTLIVHVLTDEARQVYDLEGLWAKEGALRRIEPHVPVQTLSTMRV